MPTLTINYYERYNANQLLWYAECVQIPEVMGWGGTKRQALVALANKLKTTKKEIIENIK